MQFLIYLDLLISHTSPPALPSLSISEAATMNDRPIGLSAIQAVTSRAYCLGERRRVVRAAWPRQHSRRPSRQVGDADSPRAVWPSTVASAASAGSLRAAGERRCGRLVASLDGMRKISPRDREMAAMPCEPIGQCIIKNLASLGKCRLIGPFQDLQGFFLTEPPRRTAAATSYDPFSRNLARKCPNPTF